MSNKRGNLIFWIAAICVLLAAASFAYSKYLPQAGPAQNSNKFNDKTLSSDTTKVEDKTEGKTIKEQETPQAEVPSEKDKIMAPDFTLKDLNGKEVKLSDYRGKIVFLNFWAVWCKFCVQEMPDLNELNKELAKDNEAVILAVDVQEKEEVVKKFLQKNNIDLKVLMDTDGAVTQAYGVTGFPTTFVVNKDGTIFTYIAGATNKQTLMEILSKMK